MSDDKAFYSVWDLETGNLIASYTTLIEALNTAGMIVRTYPDDAADFSLTYNGTTLYEGQQILDALAERSLE